MYKSVTVLNAQEHRDFRYKQVSDWLFAKNLNTVPVAFSEVAKLCCAYPLVFVAPSATLSVVVGFDQEGKNLAIDHEGAWRGEYVPAFLRRYPFALVKLKEQELALGIDLESGCFSDPDGEPLFDEKGEPRSIVLEQLEFLKAIEEQMQVTQAIAKTLQEKELLQEATLNLAQERRIGGFYLIDFEKLNNLDDATLAGWGRNGWLELFALIKHSWQNFDRLAALEKGH